MPLELSQFNSLRIHLLVVHAKLIKSGIGSAYALEYNWIASYLIYKLRI